MERKLLGLLAQSARRADPCSTAFQHFPLQLPALQWADQQNDPLLRCANIESTQPGNDHKAGDQLLSKKTCKAGQQS